jgi:rfaE bifunctional protein kinase chain/domain
MDDADALLSALGHQAVVVVGDLILDEYISGQAARISREAPVIVVEEERRDWLVGGAAMPALNVACLGSQARQCGVVGPDPAGQHLVDLLRGGGVDVSGIVVDHQRRTTTKTRVLAQGLLTFPQQVARIDRLDRHALPATVERNLLAALTATTPAPSAVLVSDYKNGVVTPAVVAGARQFAHQHGRLATVDTQGNLDQFAGFDLVKCNHHDAAAYLGRPLTNEAEVRAAIVEIQQRLGAPEIVVTRAAAGLSCYSPAEGYHHLPATNRTEVYDATGAGDTVIAVLTLARAAGASLMMSCHLANLAAGIVVRKRGNQPIERDELAAALVESA